MRIRTIKPEFWTHPVMAKQEYGIRLFAIALLNLADDKGCFNADPIIVRGAIMPYETVETIENWFEQLRKIGYVETKNIQSRGLVGRVINFLDHQKINRPGPSNLIQFFDSVNTQ